jgi:type I site-specific restriction-modification system R (restriction) subunit
MADIKRYYKDEEVLEREFCRKENCSTCDGSDENGEPNGYGCSHNEKYIEENYKYIASESEENFFYSETDVEKLISDHKAVVETKDNRILELETDLMFKEESIKLQNKSMETLPNKIEELGINTFKDRLLKKLKDEIMERSISNDLIVDKIDTVALKELFNEVKDWD